MTQETAQTEACSRPRRKKGGRGRGGGLAWPQGLRGSLPEEGEEIRARARRSGMQPQLLLLLLLLPLSFPVILTRGEAWPEVRGWDHIKSQALKGHWREESSNGDNLQGGLTDSDSGAAGDPGLCLVLGVVPAVGWKGGCPRPGRRQMVLE